MWASVTCVWASLPPRSPAARRSASSWRRTSPQSSNAGTLFIFDEPTTGLHFEDISKLLHAFERLIENGGSLVIIEHNPRRGAKPPIWVIDSRPAKAATRGGRIVATGLPEAIAAVARIPIPATLTLRESFA